MNQTFVVKRLSMFLFKEQNVSHLTRTENFILWML